VFGGMLSFDLKGGVENASKFVKALKTITLTPSLGGTHTAISHPGKTSHRFLTQDQKRESGITDAMIRVSVGIEPYQEIEEEFGHALEAA
jgi:cystathionine beta-lyase/cystathionine gamma-synthase